MALSCDVIVIGGGIVGAAVGSALAELGVDTVLVERGCVGSEGASRYSGGIVRLYDPDRRLMELTAYAYARMRDTRSGEAFSSTVRRTGVYFVLEEDIEADALATGPLLEDAARHIQVLSRREAVEGGAAIRADGPGSVLWEADGGYGDVRASARMLIQNLRRDGLVLENTDARLDSVSADGAVLRVASTEIRGRCVVIAAGSHSADLVPELALQVRSIPMARMATRRPVRMPIIDAAWASYMVPVGEGVMQVGSRARTQGDRPDDLTFDADAIVDDACRRVEAITGEAGFAAPIDIVRGYDAYGEDGPLIGHQGERSLFLAVGFSGIGYKLSIGVGWLLARRIAASLGAGPTLTDQEYLLLEHFHPARHSRHASLAETHQK